MKSILISQDQLFINGSHVDPNKYIKPGAFWGLAEKADNFARNWYKKLPAEFSHSLEYKNISLGYLIEYNAYLFFLEILKSLTLAKAIITQEKVQQIIFTSPFFPYISSIFAIEKNYLYFLPPALRVVGQQQNLKIYRQTNWIETLKQLFNWYYLNLRHQIYEKVRYTSLIFKSKTITNLDLDKEKNAHIMLIARAYQNVGLNPILKALLKGYKLKISIIGEGNLINETLTSLLPNSKNCFNLDYLQATNKEEVIRKKKNIIRAWRNLKTSSLFRKSFIFNNSYFEEVVNSWLNYIFAEHFPKAVERIAKMDQILRTTSPQLLVGTADIAEFDKTLITLGGQLEIKSLDVQSGYVSFSKMMGLTPKYADKLAVWGEETKKTYLKSGIPEERMAVTGAPKYDEILPKIRKKKINHISSKVESGLKGNKKTILVTTQPEYGVIGTHSIGMQIQMIKWILKSLEIMPNLQMILKPHQSEPKRIIDKYRKFLASYPKQTKLIINSPIDKLIEASDIIVTFASTTGLEAVMYYKPLIIINPTKSDDLVSFADEGIALRVRSYPECIAALKQILTDKNYRLFLRKQQNHYLKKAFYRLDGKSTERAVKLIKELLSASNICKL